jgi:hypothetical protein
MIHRQKHVRHRGTVPLSTKSSDAQNEGRASYPNDREKNNPPKKANHQVYHRRKMFGTTALLLKLRPP